MKTQRQTHCLAPTRLVTHKLLLLCLWSAGGCTGHRQSKFFTLAEEKIQNGSYYEAADMLRRGIILNPENTKAAKAIYRLGFLQEVYLRDYEAALLSYKEYLRLNKNLVGSYEVQKRVANIYFDYTQSFNQAIAAYKRLLDSQRDSLEKDFFHYRVGRSCFLQNNFAQAKAEYELLIEQYPKSQLVPKARFEIGNSYFIEGKYALAIEAFKQVLRFHAQNPQAIEAQFWIAQSYEQIGSVKEARNHYEQLRLKYPTPEVIEKHLRELNLRERKRG